MTGWLDGLEAAARERLPEPVHRYFRQGAAAGVSTAEAVAAWRRLRFLPHVLRDVSTVSTATTVLGAEVATPILVAPTTLQRHAHPDGEAEMARGVAAAGSLMCVSSNAGSTFSAIAETGAAWWIQVYVARDRGLTTAMLDRAVASGATAVVVTVDTPVVGAKHDDGPSVWEMTPAGYLLANLDLDGASADDLEKALDLTPDDVGWLARSTGLPVVVKGVLRADDAALAARAGAAGVWVSNHGGRQLDRALATADALPAVGEAVAGDAEVYVDGGIRDGRDSLAALASGATAVFVGRPPLWGLCVGGAGGVTQVLTELTVQLREAMTLCGVTSIAAVGSDLLSGQG
ncbi:MAG: alpha-hydroxy-acid oxidizing protein [Nocardioidaceae bacterium]|nr:alpha-hydroxy-acid oxidizing protein [Nocardioidaceae bacterium]